MISSPRESNGGRSVHSRFQGTIRPLSLFVLFVLTLTQIPVASAHDGTGALGLSRADSIFVIIAGLVLLAGMIFLKRTDRLSPTAVLYGILGALAVVVLGTVLFDGLTPDPTYTASSMPFSRSWYPLLGLSVGLVIAVLSFVLGWLRWRTRPRYMFLGLLMGTWISYPYLVTASNTHPLGYAIVLATPMLVGYILWMDVWEILRMAFRDRVVRHFGIGVGFLAGLFFLSTTGYLSFFWEEGAPTETTIVVLPVNYQLVQWPTLEIALPQIPLFFAMSIGIATVVGLLSVLIGFNAALVARHWRLKESAGFTESTIGTGTVVGGCTCGCCGPLVAKVAILAAGPSIAAPLYWIFVDTASPLSSAFIVASIVLFTGNLVYSIKTARQPDQLASLVSAD